MSVCVCPCVSEGERRAVLVGKGRVFMGKGRGIQACDPMHKGSAVGWTVPGYGKSEKMECFCGEGVPSELVLKIILCHHSLSLPCLSVCVCSRRGR